MAANIVEYISAEKIAQRVQELGKQITHDYRGRCLHVVGVLNGSLIFLSDLVRHIDLEPRIDFLGLRSYGGHATETSGIVQITKDLAMRVDGCDVLVVEDIVDTGLTMAYLLRNLATRNPRSVTIATLLHKPSRKRVDVPLDYVGFEIEDKFVVGYGMDYDDLYRNLPYIGVMG